MSTATSRLASPRFRSSSSRPTRASPESAPARTRILTACFPRSRARIRARSRPCTTACSPASSRRVTPARPSAASARSTWRCGTSRPNWRGSRCGASSARATDLSPGTPRAWTSPSTTNSSRPSTRTWRRAGFASGKLKGGLDLDADIRRLGIIADALRVNSPQPGLMLDANESWNLKQAVRYVTKIEEVHDLAWIEEPLRRWDAEGHARLSAFGACRGRHRREPDGLEQFGPLFNAGGIDVVQAAATWGVTHFLRVAIAAHSRDLPVSPVGLTANAAVAHAAASIPNHLSAEIQDVGAPFGVAIDQEYRRRRQWCSVTRQASASRSTRPRSRSWSTRAGLARRGGAARAPDPRRAAARPRSGSQGVGAQSRVTRWRRRPRPRRRSPAREGDGSIPDTSDQYRGPSISRRALGRTAAADPRDN